MQYKKLFGRMAPFKLKFRMGSSRSASQEHDQDPQVNEALLNHHQHHSTTIGASSSTIDSTDCTSLGSIGTNERKSLLPNKSNNLRLGKDFSLFVFSTFFRVTIIILLLHSLMPHTHSTQIYCNCN